MDEMIAEKQNRFESIKNKRRELADLVEQKNTVKASLWDEATGTVDQKKDYIRSKTADVDKLIAYLEADIEYEYNMIALLTDKMVYCDE